MILKAVGIESVRLPARSPNLNAFAERFVRTIKQSCLDRMVLIGESSLHRAIGSLALIITPKKTIRDWGTTSSGPSSPNSRRRVPFIVASGWADYCAIITVKPRDDADVGIFGQYGAGSSALRAWSEGNCAGLAPHYGPSVTTRKKRC